jgi:hypothetical protein
LLRGHLAQLGGGLLEVGAASASLGKASAKASGGGEYVV